MKISILLSVLFLFISCGKDGITIPKKVVTVYKVEPAVAEDYSYEFTKAKCTTDKQNFGTFILACDGLKNHVLNNECAEDKREELFINSECPGDFS